MKRRGFLLPFAVSVAALLGSSSDAVLVPGQTPGSSPATISQGQQDRLGDLVIERSSGSSAQTAQHSSHYSHRSHRSHSSHQSHYSHYSGY